MTHLPSRSWCPYRVKGKLNCRLHASEVGGAHDVPEYLMD